LNGRVALLVFAGASALLLACGAAQTAPAPPVVASADTASGEASDAAAGAVPPREASRATVELWRARCGQCHVRVEPGTRDRATLSKALSRHQKRAKLSPSDVRDLVDYLGR
jgi:cytochrome c5